jgi:epoxide hydrolase-like predicted phosphatase
MIRAVIFDFGGVLVRTEDQSGRIKWERTLGLSQGELSHAVFDSDAALKASLGVLPEQAIWEHVAELYQLSPLEVAELRTDFWSGDRLDTELVNFLRSLRPRYKTAILSNAWSGARITFREKYDLETAVDLIVISAEEGLAKPAPEIFVLVARRLAVPPKDAIFVDDFSVNIRAAQAAGFSAVHFRNTNQTIDEIMALIQATTPS